MYKLRCELRGHEQDVCGICICGNADIATSSRDRTVRLWSLDPSDERRYAPAKIMQGHTSFVGPVAWIEPSEEYPEGRVVAGGLDMLVWDLNTGEMVQTLKGHQLQVTGIAFDDGDIVSCSLDNTIKRWRNGQLVESWEAHKSAIQVVINLPSGELVTGSSDTTLKLWRGTTCTRTFVGHTDTVTSLAMMSGLGVLSASRDGSIRLWALSGEVLMEMVEHTSIVCSVDSHASGLIVSSSEDCFTKIWKDGVCVQSIEHPGCVWDAKFLVTGDIVTACSDGVVRIWTVNQDKIADALDLESYFSQLSQHKVSRKRVGGWKLEDLPGLEALKIPGTSDGQTKIVREGDNDVAYLWNVREQKWDKIGEAVAGPDDGLKRPVFTGSEYDCGQDHVDIGDSVPIPKLLYNRSEKVVSPSISMIFDLVCHGTTNIVIRINSGVVIAVDSRAVTTRYFSGTSVEVGRIVSDADKKVNKITPTVCITACGSANRNERLKNHLIGLVQEGVCNDIKKLRTHAHSYMKDNPPKSLQRGIELYMVGWSHEEKACVVYRLKDGFDCPVKLNGLYDAIGSGSYYAMKALSRENIALDMTNHQAFHAARRALLEALQDPGSGGILRVYIATESGCRWLCEKHAIDLILHSPESLHPLNELYVILPREDGNDLSQFLTCQLLMRGYYVRVICLGVVGHRHFLYRVSFDSERAAQHMFSSCTIDSRFLFVRLSSFLVHPTETALGYVGRSSRTLLRTAQHMSSAFSL